MRNISDNYIQAVGDAPFEGRYILRIDFPAPNGTRYFSAGPMRELDDCDDVLEELEITRSDGRVRVAAVLQDPGGFFSERFRAGELEGRPARVFHAVESLPPEEWLPIVAGCVDPGTRFETETGRIRLMIASGPFDLRKSLGLRSDRDFFPLIHPADVGRMLPVVYGRTNKVRAVAAGFGACSVLARPLTPADDSLWISHPTGFPSSTILIRAGDENLKGFFTGGKFTITEREAVVVEGCTTHYTANAFTIRDVQHLSAEEEIYAGLYVYLEVGGKIQRRRIISSVGGDSRLLRFSPPFLDSNLNYYKVPPGRSFTVRSVAGHQPIGSPVIYVPSGGSAYIVSDRPAHAVKNVYVVSSETGELVPVDTAFWSATESDSTTFPELDNPAATITFPRPPSLIPSLNTSSDVVYADVEGAEDGEGEVVESPAAVIRHILENRLGVAQEFIDLDAFDTAAEELPPVKFAFALARPIDGWLLCRSLASQALAVLDFSGDRLALQALPAALDAEPALELSGDETLAEKGFPLRVHGGQPEPVSVLRCIYGTGPDAMEFTVSDADAVTRFGERLRKLDLFAVPKRSDAEAVANLWLERLAEANTEVELAARPELARLTPGDVVSITFDSELDEQQRAEVLETSVLERSGNRPERCRLKLRLPIREGCASACEAACESDCQSGCEAFCETGCESACEDSCEVSCQVVSEMGCYTACELSCTAACRMQCQVGCELGEQTGCAGSCQAEYETGCDSSCVSSCEAECIVFCESGCESAGESGCGTAEETGCGAACESGCETSCETGEEEIIVLSVNPDDTTQVTDHVNNAMLSDLFTIMTINDQPVLCLKDGLFVSDGTHTAPFALKYDPAAGRWGVDLAFYSESDDS